MNKNTKAKSNITSLSKTNLKNNAEFALLLLPGFLLLLIFNYLPMLGVIIAFKDYNPLLGIIGSKWIGLKNFEFFFSSMDAFRTLRNTLGYNIVFIFLGKICAITLALMFYFLHSVKMRKIYNTIVIIPKFISIVLIAFIVQILLNHSNGVFNAVITALGGDPIKWYAEPKYWPVILTTVHLWQTIGTSSVIFYATLMGLDQSLIEAGQIDGANVVNQIRFIILPYLKQIIALTIILDFGHVFFGDFGLFYQVPMDIGLLYPTTDIINTYTFRALQEGSLAKSAAVGLFQSTAGMVLVIMTNFVVKKISPEDSLF